MRKRINSGSICTGAGRGFTLLELMIVVVIIAILAAIALPNYLKYVQRTRRSDAQSALMNAAQAEEKYYYRCNTYGSLGQIYGVAAPTCTATTDSIASPQGYYTLSLNAISANTYTLWATPVATGPQKDDQCGTLTLDNTGLKGTSADAANATDGDTLRCWH